MTISCSVKGRDCWINHIDTFTGITDKDRALTITAMSDVCSKIDKDGTLEFAKKFRSPGHVHILIGAKELLKKDQVTQNCLLN